MGIKIDRLDALDALRSLPSIVQQALADVTDCLPPNHFLYLIGGSVIDVILRYPEAPKIRDLDCLIFGPASLDDIAARLGNFPQERNSFDSIKLRHPGSGLPIDIWPAKSHSNWRQNIDPATVSDTLRLSTLNINAIAWCPKLGCLIDEGCFEALRTGCLELFNEPDDSGVYAILETRHILVTIAKYRDVLVPGPKLQSFLAKQARRPIRDEVFRQIAITLSKRQMTHDELTAYTETIERWFSI